MKTKINPTKVEVHHIGYFGSMTKRVMDIEVALSHVETGNDKLISRGINNNKNFQDYLTILPYFGR